LKLEERSWKLEELSVNNTTIDIQTETTGFIIFNITSLLTVKENVSQTMSLSKPKRCGRCSVDRLAARAQRDSGIADCEDQEDGRCAADQAAAQRLPSLSAKMFGSNIIFVRPRTAEPLDLSGVTDRA
jgi:hypothetical protein